MDALRDPFNQIFKERCPLFRKGGNMIKIKCFGGSILPGSNDKTLSEAERFLNIIGRENIINISINYIGTTGTLRVFITYNAE